MAHLSLALLGPFQATLDGEPAKGLNSDHLRALLAYLAVESEREHAREALASLLWPERSDREALNALRHALANLRCALGEQSSPGDRRSPGDPRAPSPFLLVSRTSLQFNQASDHWLDVAEFLALTGSGRGDPTPTDLSGLTRAASLYRGPFVDGLSVGDSPAFDEWLLLKDEEYRRGVLSVLDRLTSLQTARAEYAEAARWARRQLELEPYREQAHRQLMVALGLGGERSAALAHYEACRRLLAQELGYEPDDKTRALYAQIRDGTLSQPLPSVTSPTILAATRQAPTPSSGQAPTPSSGQALSTGGAESRPYPPPTRKTAGGQGQDGPRFVAREQELARLGTLLDWALAGQGGLALITGEAGGGKTALLDEWARRAAQAYGDLIVLRGSCNAHAGAGDPYLPFREMLQTLAGDVEGKRAGGTLSAEQARRAWEALPAVGAALVEHGPDLVDTFVPGEALLRRVEAFPGPAGTGRWQAKLRGIVRRAQEGAAPAPQADLFAQVTQVLHAISVGRPLLLAIDDLQWADGGTAALLFHLGRRLAGSRILLACAYRPEALRDPLDPMGLPRPLRSVLQELTRDWGDVLVDLDEADGQAFVEAYIDSEPNRLGTRFRQAVYDHTDGNPLFTVELLRSFEREGALVQDGAGRWVEAAGPDWERWPPQVEAVIAGHLGGLPDEDRALLQAASVQGQQFAAEIAARALGWDEEAAIRRLSGPLRTRHRLVEAVSLDRLPLSGQRLSHYRFRHSLVQRAAYQDLDAVQRARLHEATGRALEAIFAAEAERPPALAPDLARHFETAGMPLEAARYRLEAGRWAARLVAYDEAIAHLERGLALLEGVAASPERLRLELALCLAIVNPAMLRRGWRAPAYTRALERISDLTQHPELQDDPQRLAALSVLALLVTLSADPERGQRVGEQLLRQAPTAASGQAPGGDRQSLILAHWVLGHSYWWQGQLVAAREHLSQALALHNPQAGFPLGPLLGADPAVIGRAVLGFMLWLLGYPDQGRASLRQATAQAQELEQPSSAAFAHLMAGMAYLVLGRDGAAALSHSRALQPLSKAGLEYGVWAELLAGQAPTEASGQAQDGQGGAARSEPIRDRGLTRAAEAGSALQATGPGVGHAARLLVQAQRCASAARPEIGLEALDRAQAWIEHTGVRVLEAEVWRMRGELLLLGAQGASDLTGALHPASPAEAEACFRRALEMARVQEARWLELRAAVSLARLWQAQGRREEARELLAGIYDWFTEGFDTVDLVEAKALLEDLA